MNAMGLKPPKQQETVKIPTANDPAVKAAAAKKRQDDDKTRMGRQSTNLSTQPVHSRTRLG